MASKKRGSSNNSISTLNKVLIGLVVLVGIFLVVGSNDNDLEVTGYATNNVPNQISLIANSLYPSYGNCFSSSCEYGPSKAVDDNLGTRWASNRWNDTQQTVLNNIALYPAYLVVSSQKMMVPYRVEPFNISEISLLLHGVHAQDYYVEYLKGYNQLSGWNSDSWLARDGFVWQRIASKNGATGLQIHKFEPAIQDVTYLRIGITKSADNSQANIYDLKIFDANSLGSQQPPAQEPPTQPTPTIPQPVVKSCIDIQDTAYISQYFGATTFPSEVDLNKDGQISILDSSILSSVFGSCQGDANYNLVYDISELILTKSEQLVETCVDSDGGLNFYVKGTAKFLNGSTTTDICYTSGYLLEANCGGAALFYTCPNGCLDGACVAPVPTTPTESLSKLAAESQPAEPAPVAREAPQQTSCTSGCLSNGACLPIGTRTNDGLYCSLSQVLEAQMLEGQVCSNNFECNGNACVNGECISSSVWQKFLGWFARLGL